MAGGSCPTAFNIGTHQVKNTDAWPPGMESVILVLREHLMLAAHNL